jgi:hypothetical protein
MSQWSPTPPCLNPEQVAYWFFRLQGCLTITNFILHNFNDPGSPLSDGDVIAIRFPHRVEDKMQDDEDLFSNHKIDVSIVEVKFSVSSTNLNPPWLKDQTVIQEVIQRIGFVPEIDVSQIATELHEKWLWEDEKMRIRVLAVTKKVVDPPTVEMPLRSDQQLEWDAKVLPFVHHRLTTWKKAKSYHPQWDDTGQHLYKLANDNYSEKRDFITAVTNAMINSKDKKRCKN